MSPPVAGQPSPPGLPSWQDLLRSMRDGRFPVHHIDELARRSSDATYRHDLVSKAHRTLQTHAA